MRIIIEPVQTVLIAHTRVDWDRVAELMEKRGLSWHHENAGLSDNPDTGEERTVARFPPKEDDGDADLVLDLYGSDGALLAEFAGRGCYNSFGGKNGAGMGRSTNAGHVGHLIEVGHGSVLEHVTYTFAIYNCSRGLTHELVRHRVGMAYSQASTRFRDESKGAFVVPTLIQAWMREPARPLSSMATAQDTVRGLVSTMTSTVTVAYDRMVRLAGSSGLLDGLVGTSARKAARGIARSFLPLGLEAPITVTMNGRAARNLFDQRATVHAEPEIRQMAVSVWRELMKVDPVLFGDYELREHVDGTEYLFTPHPKV